MSAEWRYIPSGLGKEAPAPFSDSTSSSKAAAGPASALKSVQSGWETGSLDARSPGDLTMRSSVEDSWTDLTKEISSLSLALLVSKQDDGGDEGSGDDKDVRAFNPVAEDSVDISKAWVMVGSQDIGGTSGRGDTEGQEEVQEGWVGTTVL